jgi:hypothetical protein
MVALEFAGAVVPSTMPSTPLNVHAEEVAHVLELMLGVEPLVQVYLTFPTYPGSQYCVFVLMEYETSIPSVTPVVPLKLHLALQAPET